MSELARSIEAHVHDWRLLDVALGLRSAIDRLDVILAEHTATPAPEPLDVELVDAVLGLVAIRDHLAAALAVADHGDTDGPAVAPPVESLFR